MAEDFAGLLGNRDNKWRLSSAVRRGTLSHAFLLYGPTGVGRHTLATEVAAALNCANAGNEGIPIPCRSCSACRRILAGQHPDVHLLARAQDKATIGVDDIRSIRDDMFLSPSEASVKIYIIENAESMTIQAQNALLKVLEEPPQRVVIFLLTSALDPILITVKSRAQLIRMERLDEATLLRTLAERARDLGVELRDDAMLRIAKRCDGVLGEALNYIRPKILETEEKKRQTVVDLLNALSKKASYSTLHQAVSALGQKRQDFSECAALLCDAMRDLIALKKAEDAPLLFFTDIDEGRRLSDACTARELCATYDALLAAMDKLSRNANMTLLISELAVALKKKS